MAELWYAILCFMLVVFVVLDGWNMGAGALHFYAARTPAERRTIVAALGPLWPWHEVWLLSAGGVLFLAFPGALASALTGYYLAFFLVIWCFIVRGIALEVGGHLEDALWRAFWDFMFAVSSALLPVLLGAALGNQIRGAPIDENGRFSLSFFTNFGTTGEVGILDWYTISVGVFALVCLTTHGAIYLAYKTEGPVHDRARGLVPRLCIAIAVLLVVITAETAYVRPGLFEAVGHRPLAWLFVLVVLGGTHAVFTGEKRGDDRRALLGSCAAIVGLLGAGATAIYPVLLYSTIHHSHSITAMSAATAEHGLGVALVWFPFALGLAIAYFVYVFKHFTGKVGGAPEDKGYA